VRVEGAAVTQRVNRDDAKRKRVALRFEQSSERAPDVSVTD
jgi:hypothetical protein